MVKPEFVDTHVHFYDMQHPELVYAHWAPDVDHPTLGTQMRKLGERNFVAEDYIEVTRPLERGQGGPRAGGHRVGPIR